MKKIFFHNIIPATTSRQHIASAMNFSIKLFARKRNIFSVYKNSSVTIARAFLLIEYRVHAPGRRAPRVNTHTRTD